MKRVSIICIILISVLFLFSQTPEWQWAIQPIGSVINESRGIAIDDSLLYLTGDITDTVSFGNHVLTSNGASDLFVAQISTNGNWLWAINAGGNDWDMGTAITIESTNSIYVSGNFSETGYFSPYSITSFGGLDIFVAKIDSHGSWLWVAQAGGNGNDNCTAIANDSTGNCFVTGDFRGISTFGSYTISSNENTDVYVAKIDSNGNWLWVTQLVGGNFNEGKGITTDSIGNCYVTGRFSGTSYFGTISLTSYGNSDIFVAKIDENGNWLWVAQAGGYGYDRGSAITIDIEGNCYLTGDFEGSATFGSYTIAGINYDDIFVAKIDSEGNWIWATQASGLEWNIGTAITINNNENIYLTGQFGGTASFGSHSIISSGYRDVFVAEIDVNGNWLWVNHAGDINGMGNCCGSAIAVDDMQNSYLTGDFENTALFGSYFLNSIALHNFFISKLGYGTLIGNSTVEKISQFSNHPNPFNPTTTIEFSILNDSKIEISIFNIKGQKIKTLTQNEFTKGSHSIIWNGDDEFNKRVSSGIYFYKLKVDDKTEAVRKCLLLK